jgi:type II secretory pathway predicted ATPase ExeA
MNHLIESIQEFALKDAQTRINLINSSRWIKYPAADQILNRLEELLVFPKVARMPNLLIVGDTNNGKTILMNRFFNLHKPEIVGEDEKLKIPVVYMQAPPVPDEKRFYNQLLDSLHAPYGITDKVERKQRQAINVMQLVETKILIIDEIHNILAGNMAKQRTFLNVIKYLANELQIVIVAVGIKEALNAVNTDSQIANRFTPMFLPKWHYNEDYIRLLASFERLLPLQKSSNLISEKLSSEIFDMSEGTIGEITNVLTLASIEAIKSGTEKIDLKILKNIPYVRPSERRRLTDRLF